MFPVSYFLTQPGVNYAHAIEQMFFNWTTIDSCFLSTRWHVRTPGDLFGTCLAAILLVLSLECLRRLQRTFDQYLRTKYAVLQLTEYDASSGHTEDLKPEDCIATSPLVESRFQTSKFKPKRNMAIMIIERCARSFLSMLQFGTSYCIMLLAMYFNGKHSSTIFS
jgi:copper transporter 1